MAPLPGLKVITSPIHGYGIAATRDFQAGEIVAIVDGVVRPAGEGVDDTYCLLLDGVLFDMVDQTRWINHSCEPNCEIEGEGGAPGGAWARLRALRHIAAGEEISYDYAFDASLAEPCRCGADCCRGWIVDADQLHLMRDRAATT